MEKHLLVAISDGTRASYVLRTLHSLFADTCDLRLTLFYAAPTRPGWDDDPKRFMPDTGAKPDPKGQAVLRQARKWLLDVAGCDEGKIETKVVGSQAGVVSEIIAEGHSGLYDALLLGKSVYTRFEALFENSVSYEMLWRDMDFPIWICRRPDELERRDVLLGVDGSLPARRMADHVGFMLADQPEHRIVLTHVSPPGSSIPGDLDEMFQQATDALTAHGVAEERVEVKLLRSGNPAKAIAEEHARRRFAAIAMGKRGDAPGALESVFPSSLCVKLLRLVEDTTILISK